MIGLDRNESYWLLDEDLVSAARDAIGAREFATYPDYGALTSALARYAGVADAQVLVTPGSDAAIEYLARAYGSRGPVLLPVPTFYGYETILDRVGVDTVPIAYEERDGRFVFPRAAVVEALARGTASILFLCQPNNPLGAALSADDVAAIAAAARGSDTLIVSDEAYFEFSSGTSFAPQLAALPNLVILRSFSKSFGLAGARVGYLLAAPEVVRRANGQRLIWAVTHPSVAFAAALLAREPAVRARRDAFIAARGAFARDLAALPGVTVYPSETNFFLLRVRDAAGVRERLLAAGVRTALGAPMSRFSLAAPLLGDTLRLAVPSPEDHAAVLAALRAAIPAAA
jgi:histidinol-phosphate aminotransferase